jgi:hypothetical protein
MYNNTTAWMKAPTPDFRRGEKVRAVFTIDIPLLEGSYELGVDVVSADLSHYYDRIERALGFWVKSTNGARGLVDLGAGVTFERLGDRVAT